MLEPPAGLLAKGIAPRLWLRLGVPLIVPDMTGGISNDGRPLGERSGWLKVNQGDAHETGSRLGFGSRDVQQDGASRCKQPMPLGRRWQSFRGGKRSDSRRTRG